MSAFENAVQLKKLLVTMEKDIGLEKFSDAERSVFYAAVDLDIGEAIHTRVIRSHLLTVDVTQATFYRALKTLVEKGFLSHEDGTKAGQYRVMGAV